MTYPILDSHYYLLLMLLSYHASHEQHSPSDLLGHVRAAEDAGFDGVLSSDHLLPWLEEQGESGFSWSWLGAALQATRLPFGLVCAPGDRYHPAVVAQAAATLVEMFPGRFWLSVGTGEALNEHVTGNSWPPKSVRQARLLECVEVMRALWRGETVDHDGLVKVSQARLYSLPDSPIELFGAAVSEETAEWIGNWGDGLITTGRTGPEMKSIIEAFNRGGGAGKPVYVQHPLAWAATEDRALSLAHEQWRFSALDSDRLWDLRTPEEFADATRGISPAMVAEKIPVSASLDFHLSRLEQYAEVGVHQVFCFNVGREQRDFIEEFGERVLPRLRG